MLVPEFMQFYSYTASQVLDEYARTFLSLVNAMYRLKAKESLSSIANTATATHGGDGYVNELKKQERGIHGILEEVKVIKSIRKDKKL